MKNLPDLIAEHKGKRSYASLAEATGGRVTPKNFQTLATSKGPKSFPTPTALEGIAISLDLPITGIVLAAAKSLGLNVQPFPDVEELKEQLLYYRLHADAYKKQLTTLQDRVSNTPTRQETRQP